MVRVSNDVPELATSSFRTGDTHLTLTVRVAIMITRRVQIVNE